MFLYTLLQNRTYDFKYLIKLIRKSFTHDKKHMSLTHAHKNEKVKVRKMSVPWTKPSTKPLKSLKPPLCFM